MLYIEMANDNTFCEQRFLSQLFNIPITRINPQNPYLSRNFTKHQLDMRRKAEILKYNANKSSSQTNNLTKKEKFALLVRGGLSRSAAVIKSNDISCEADGTIPTPTSSCDVPGPVISLVYDKNVPLYNYSEFNTRPYSNIARDYVGQWQFVVLPNILVYDNGTSIILYLLINNSIDRPIYKYNIVMPIGISVAGVIPAFEPSNNVFSGEVSISFAYISLEIYFNTNNLVKRVDAASLTNLSIRLNIPQNTSSSPMPFSVNCFIGNVVFPDISLYTTATYVYTFMLNANLNIVPNNTRLFNYIATIANISSTLSDSIGCTVLSTYSAVNLGTSISGTNP